MYKAIVFDCDGTLMDAKIMIQLLYEGYQKFYPNRPKKAYEEFICCYYFTNIQTKHYLQIPDNEYDAFIASSLGDDDFIMQSTKPFDGICDVIRLLYKRGFILGINTSRIREHLLPLKEQLTPEVFHMFKYIVTSQDITSPKPSPDSMFKIQEMIGLEMHDILFIGDSKNDALCAKAAGCDFALAKWGVVKAHKLHAKYELETVEDIHKILQS